MIGRIFPSWIERTVNSTDAYTGKTFQALLLKASYTFDPTDVFVSDLTTASNELPIGVGNYARIPSLSGLSITRTGSVTKVTWSPIIFSLITATGAGAARSMVIAMVGAADSSSPLVLQQDFEAAPDADNEDISITPATTGFIQYTSSP